MTSTKGVYSESTEAGYTAHYNIHTNIGDSTFDFFSDGQSNGAIRNAKDEIIYFKTEADALTVGKCFYEINKLQKRIQLATDSFSTENISNPDSP